MNICYRSPRPILLVDPSPQSLLLPTRPPNLMLAFTEGSSVPGPVPGLAAWYLTGSHNSLVK